MPLRETVSQYWLTFQRGLFPWLAEELGPLGERHKRLVQVLEFVRVEELLPGTRGSGAGRPPESRAALARAFLAKAVFAVPTTRRWSSGCATTRPYAGCAAGRMSLACLARRRSRGPSRASRGASWLGACTRPWSSGCWPATWRGTSSRDSTAIPAREQPVRKSKPVKQKRKRGRPRKGEQRAPQPTRLQQQGSMSLEELLEDLPQVCDTGVKRNAQGYQEKWNGYKLHIDAIDGGIPVSCLLTSASLHDSQAAIPLAQLTAGRVDNLYDLMDSAYDAAEIRACSERLGHVAIIDPNPRRDAHKKAELQREALARRSIAQLTSQAWRYRERSTVERVNGRLKDELGGATRAGARPRQGALPPDVWHRRADGRPVDAPDVVSATSETSNQHGIASAGKAGTAKLHLAPGQIHQISLNDSHPFANPLQTAPDLGMNLPPWTRLWHTRSNVAKASCICQLCRRVPIRGPAIRIGGFEWRRWSRASTGGSSRNICLTALASQWFRRTSVKSALLRAWSIRSGNDGGTEVLSMTSGRGGIEHQGNVRPRVRLDGSGVRSVPPGPSAIDRSSAVGSVDNRARSHPFNVAVPTLPSGCTSRSLRFGPGATPAAIPPGCLPDHPSATAAAASGSRRTRWS